MEDATQDSSMEEAMRAAAERAAQITMTRSRLVALGQPPGPPLPASRQDNSLATLAKASTNRTNNPVNTSLLSVILEDINGDPILDDAAAISQGSLIGSDANDEISWAQMDKGKGRALSRTSPTPSENSRLYPETPRIPRQWSRRCLIQRVVLAGNLERSQRDRLEQRLTCDTLTDESSTISANKRVELLFRAGEYAEANTLLNKLLGPTNGDTGSVINERGERVPMASGSGQSRPQPRMENSQLPRSQSYQLLAGDLSSREESIDDLPLINRSRFSTARGTRFEEPTHSNHRGPRNDPHPHQSIRHPSPPLYRPIPDTRLHQPSRQEAQALFPQPAPSSRQITAPSLRTIHPIKTTEDLAEEEQVKTLLAAKKGRLVLRNSDVVENGQYLVNNESEEMENGLTPLSPVLTHWLKTFKSYIPLTAFNKFFVVDDQQEWSRRKAPTESKIDNGSASLRIYGGPPPPEELMMQFEEWIDAMSLFIKYVADAGWVTLPERFEGHRGVVTKLRDNFGWMVALRYCRRSRQGVMQETTDNKIKNFSKLQTAILDEVRLTVDAWQERAYRTNSYAAGGLLAHMNPLSGLPRTSSSSSTTIKKTQPQIELASHRTIKTEGKPADWIPSYKWRTMSAEEKEDAKRESGRRDTRSSR
ncbi:uncharacterized protein MELLADRAFT_87494 [Melampsora larici-populina 98AG31]|uniref:Uncharacterized protein n=1 Tax=Melampsora larici-populina (strain 98AG31 / pathotype 3-4-7) TaxID=747676 RepID=F4RNH8_MELLP|nr:uncharacterized protein MELLADRAFT_87494 [Melampsora larici-populina 98AG31]EGG05992.1 hypothetical protein MELLADRAFT_87494 [Melampsora larici-populina 98AG31]